LTVIGKLLFAICWQQTPWQQDGYCMYTIAIKLPVTEGVRGLDL